MKTDTDFESFVANMHEQGVKRKQLPEDLVMSKNSLDVLKGLLDNLEEYDFSIKHDQVKIMQIAIAGSFMRGYAEGKYHD